MGSSVSPLCTDLIMQDLEHHCLGKLRELHDYVPLVYFSYVDGTFLCVKQDLIDVIFNCFNSYYGHVRFNREVEMDASLNY